MTSTVKYINNLRTESVHTKSGNIVITDAPTDNNGKGEAFSPTDLLATSLAQCIITIMGIKANEKNICIDNTRAEVTKFMASEPRRVSEILVDLFIKGDFTDKEKVILENSGKTCPVSKSLHPDIKQNITFHWSK